MLITPGGLLIFTGIHKMIVWVMHHEADAMYLLPEYNKIRQQAEDRDEGSAKNHGLEV